MPDRLRGLSGLSGPSQLLHRFAAADRAHACRHDQGAPAPSHLSHAAAVRDHTLFRSAVCMKTLSYSGSGGVASSSSGAYDDAGGPHDIPSGPVHIDRYDCGTYSSTDVPDSVCSVGEPVPAERSPSRVLTAAQLQASLDRDDDPPGIRSAHTPSEIFCLVRTSHCQNVMCSPLAHALSAHP